jgi:Zn-dependent protease with chaperone function
MPLDALPTIDFLATLRRRARRIARNGNIWVRIWLSLSLCIGGIGGIILARGLLSVSDSEFSLGISVLTLLLTLLPMLLVWPGLIGFWVAQGRFHRLLRKRYLAEPPQSVRREIEPMLEELSARMGPEMYPLRLRLHLWNASASPSIDVERKKYGDAFYLVLPLGFLLVLRIDPEAARAMLAHELGHVVQGDVRQFRAFNAFVRGAVLTQLRCFVVLYILLLGWILFTEAESIRFSGLLQFNISLLHESALEFLVPVVALWRLRVARSLSEAAADLAAAVVVGREPIERAIRMFGGGLSNGFRLLDVHPSVDKRLRILAKALDRVANPPPLAHGPELVPRFAGQPVLPDDIQ